MCWFMFADVWTATCLKIWPKWPGRMNFILPHRSDLATTKGSSGWICVHNRDHDISLVTGTVKFTQKNILVNALCPGFTLTELTESILSGQEIKALSSDIPLGRFAGISEIARIAVFLCSDLNGYMTGQVLLADGGFTVR